ncbi:NAD(P)-dependent alcohol dehydrogenase [Streptomyces sp. SID13666]|uniref:zinc-dependent alcohol dehydrogenase family protein n=1 Tax=unclassified Streptomyces TaxID=2593676 RepID=UPI0013C06010|nr:MULTISPECIES: NAD(P)-dependent alcohol dehydrogenase [unclassified Streptomyces]NEA52950.1 NAD(P)-dependent alcohol dehydrogenase [Streptomyces sp. SID13666]NEA69723.1 NAD(P)-dependent alcohol dehydrogenase [Streptomyces sp. SID13588]
MRSYHVNSGAGIEGLSIKEHADPVPGTGQVLVAVKAVSLSNRELMVLRGNYVLPVKPDVIPVSDGAGEVVALGPGVHGVKIGDRVAATLFPSWQDGPFGLQHLPQRGGSLDGMLTELALISEESLVPVPDHLSYQEAAALPCVGVTAWNALTGDGIGLRAGETLVTQGSGGVSLFALQFAKALGARVIATTSSPDKARRLIELGADEVIDYRSTPDWASKVVELTGGRGADRVVDVAGLLEQSLKAVAVAGHVACVGFVSGTAQPLDPGVLFASGAVLRTVAVGSRNQFLAMNRALQVNRIHPVIDREFTFEEAPDAYRFYASGKAFGKVVITL